MTSIDRTRAQDIEDCQGMTPNRNQAVEQKNQTMDEDINQRNLQLDAYHSVAFAFFATGGGMTVKKESMLRELRERWQIPEASWNVKNKRAHPRSKSESQSKSESKPTSDCPAV